ILYIETIALIVMAVFTIFWAYIADKYERMIVLKVSIGIWTFFCGLSVLAQDPGVLLIFQLGMFFGVAAIVPTTYSMSIDLVNKYSRSESFGWLSVAQNLGAGLAFILGGFLVDFTGWRIPFIILAVLGASALPLLMRYSEPESGKMEAELYEVFKQCETYNYKISLKDFQLVLKPISNFWLLTCGFISMICTGAVGFIFVTMMQIDHGTSSTLATIFLIIMFLPQMCFPILFGKLSDKRAEKNPLILIKILIACTIITLVGYSLGFLIPFRFDLSGTLTSGRFLNVIGFGSILLLSLGISSGIPPMLFSALSYVNTPETRSTIYSISNVTRTAGRGIGIAFVAFLTANIYNGYYSFSLSFSTIFLGLSLIFIIPLYRTYKKDIKWLQTKLSSRADEILGNKSN
ncbi:MAG: MFS transporter, partial [Candidatus Helarchaeota archaeon]